MQEIRPLVYYRFWYQYSNINALVEALELENPFTEWTRSSFWAPDGLQVFLISAFGSRNSLFATACLPTTAQHLPPGHVVQTHASSAKLSPTLIHYNLLVCVYMVQVV